MTTKFKQLAAAVLIGSSVMAIEPAAAQRPASGVTEAQKAECLKMAQEFEKETRHHGVTVRSDCLKRAADKNAAARWEYTCTQTGGKAVYGCSKSEKDAQTAAAARAKQKADADAARAPSAQQKAQADAARAARMQREMDAEAKALKKIQDERQRSKPTTETCYMKNGKLDCKPQ
jgi:colicin import membrane protein